MRVAVTGSTGFVGSHLVNRFRSAGHDVAALARSESKARSLPPNVEVVIGDICDRDALQRLVAGAEVVFHTVSNFRTASDPPEAYQHVNVEGTRRILDETLKAGARRFIHCSTIGVHGHLRVTPGDEEAPFAPGDLYQTTKLQSEEHARQRVGETATEIVVVRPCSIYGPGDLRMLKMFRMLSKGMFVKIGPCRENFHAVYIDDLVEAFARTAEVPGLDGEVFVIGGAEYLSLDRYIDAAAEAVESNPPFIRLPYGMMYGAAWLCERLCVPLRIEPPLHVRRVRFFRNNRAFSIDKARRLLGYSPAVDLAEGMRRTVAWYRAQGLLPQQARRAHRASNE